MGDYEHGTAGDLQFRNFGFRWSRPTLTEVDIYNLPTVCDDMGDVHTPFSCELLTMHGLSANKSFHRLFLFELTKLL